MNAEEVDQLDGRIRKLYRLGKELNWNAEVDVDWRKNFPKSEYPVDPMFNPFVGYGGVTVQVSDGHLPAGRARIPLSLLADLGDKGSLEFRAGLPHGRFRVEANDMGAVRLLDLLQRGDDPRAVEVGDVDPGRLQVVEPAHAAAEVDLGAQHHEVHPAQFLRLAHRLRAGAGRFTADIQNFRALRHQL